MLIENSLHLITPEQQADSLSRHLAVHTLGTKMTLKCSRCPLNLTNFNQTNKHLSVNLLLWCASLCLSLLSLCLSLYLSFRVSPPLSPLMFHLTVVSLPTSRLCIRQVLHAPGRSGRYQRPPRKPDHVGKNQCDVTHMHYPTTLDLCSLAMSLSQALHVVAF